MASYVLSFNADETLVERLDHLTGATELDRQHHLRRALRCYLETESWHLQTIAQEKSDTKTSNRTDLEVFKMLWARRAG